MHQLTKRVMRRLGVMAPGEDFNSEEWKSKLIFFTTQGLYSILVSLPTMWLYSSYSLRFNKDNLIIKRDLETIEEFERDFNNSKTDIFCIIKWKFNVELAILS